MSFLNLGKKLSPAGKAWKGLASSLQTNLRKLISNSKPIKRTKKRFDIILARSTKSLQPKRRKKKRGGRTGKLSMVIGGTHSAYGVFNRGFEPVYVDQLFASSSTNVTLSIKGEEARKDQGGSGSSSSKPAMPWEVDERAEKFITKFRREMSLQRKRSLDDFQERLARSA
ncbi:hypothetical protein H6P81_011779 [Aristolochia fimbriata]|uniref:Uncharacterized protein n=1 Tax=Aristolochia fimbriata TaxID=158543 RepID=A0AAV7ED19_ARIFI|nr:hypothetical protein H6P81_011779 [Aristolochia fimbriata]